jgi:hypothetical protein
LNQADPAAAWKSYSLLPPGLVDVSRNLASATQTNFFNNMGTHSSFRDQLSRRQGFYHRVSISVTTITVVECLRRKKTCGWTISFKTSDESSGTTQSGFNYAFSCHGTGRHPWFVRR